MIIFIDQILAMIDSDQTEEEKLADLGVFISKSEIEASKDENEELKDKYEVEVSKDEVEASKDKVEVSKDEPKEEDKNEADKLVITKTTKHVLQQ